MSNVAYEWFRKRNRGVFLTVRDVDCAGFDAQRLADDLALMHVTYVHFFASGYVTLHPTELADLRISPYLGGRDLVGEVVTALHGHGIAAVPAVELAIIPEEVAKRHPDWCAQEADGTLQPAGAGLIGACPLSGYVQSYSREVVAEILRKYPADGIYFTGLGWRDRICQCERCRADFDRAAGADLPESVDWNNPLYRRFVRWRLDKTTEMSRLLVGHVKSFDPDLPVISGGVYFGEPTWTTRASLDFEAYTACQDGLFSEAQTRLKAGGITGEAGAWQPFLWSGEAARYLDSVGRGRRPVIITASYFMAWPWRRSAAPALEQKMFLSQIVANGGTIKVNLSGGPPSVHQDRRGFPVVKELFSFLHRNERYYEDDRSAAAVAIVHSRDTYFFYGRDRIDERYLDELRGIEQALLEAHVPFDIISTATLADSDALAPYRALILPNLASLSESEAAAIRAYGRRGGGIVATHETSLCDSDGIARRDFLLADLLRASYRETRDVMAPASAVSSPDAAPRQCYLEITQPSHPLLAGIVDTEVIPVIGRHCAITPLDWGAAIPLRLGAPFRVFPEGFAYPTEAAAGHPMALASAPVSSGRVVYYPFQIGSMFWRAGVEDLAALIVNAVEWVGGEPDLKVEAPSTLQLSLRTKGNLRMVHLLNLTGGRRFFRQLVPLHDIEVGLRGPAARAFRLSDGTGLPLREHGGRFWVTVERLADYDVVVFETAKAKG